MLEDGVYHGNKTKKTKIGRNWSAGMGGGDFICGDQSDLIEREA